MFLNSIDLLFQYLSGAMHLPIQLCYTLRRSYTDVIKQGLI